MARKHDEIRLAFGDEMMKVAGKEIAKAVAGEPLTEKTKELSDMIDAAIGAATTIDLHVFRRMEGYRKEPQFISALRGLDPAWVKSTGLPPIIQEAFGGGSYVVIVKAPNIPDKSVEVNIHGDPKRADGTTIPSANMPVQSPAMPIGFAGMPTMMSPYGPMMPGFSPFNPYMNSFMQPHKEDSMDKLLAALLVSDRKQHSEETESVKFRAQEEEIKRLREQQNKVETDRKFDELQRSNREQIDMLRFELMKLSENKKPDLLQSVAALSPSILGAVSAFVQASQGKNAQMDSLFKSIIESQKHSSDQTLGFLKLIQESPKVEDRMAKNAETVAGLMGSMVSLMGTFINSTAREGDSEKPWVSIVKQLIDGATKVAEGMFGAPQMGEEYGQAEVAAPADLEAYRTAQLQQPQGAVAGLPQGEVQQSTEASQPSKGFDRAIGKILELIVKGGDAHEIAFRIWKHSMSGHPEVKAWFDHPQEATTGILTELRKNNQIAVTDARIVEIADALSELKSFLDQGGDPQSYIDHYGLDLSLPKVYQAPVAKQMDFDTQGNQVSFGVSRATAPVMVNQIGITPPDKIEDAEIVGEEAEEETDSEQVEEAAGN